MCSYKAFSVIAKPISSITIDVRNNKCKPTNETPIHDNK